MTVVSLLVAAKVIVPKAVAVEFVPSDTVIVLLVSFAFSIDPASCALVIVPVNELVG